MSIARQFAGKPKQRSKIESDNKKLVSLRLDKDVIEKFKATGPGWQTRINEALREVQP